jgi:hypothetical protein
MNNQLNPFENLTGSGKLGKPGYIILILSVTVICAFIIAKTGIIGVVALVILPFVFFYLNFLFRYPIIGLYTAVALGFILLGLGRYVRGLQVGLGIDAILITTYLALYFSKFQEKVDWTAAKKGITYLSFVWFGYSVFQFVNPEARSVAAWFSGRGIGLYMLMIVPLTLIFVNTDRKLNLFLYIWGVFSLLATTKGIMQHFMGPDPFEKIWLDEGNAKTHILFGQLRSFSFLSDAGQFGANQAYSAVVALIFSFVLKNPKAKYFFILVAIMGIYGMIISGTRGAISVPLTGFAMFFVLRKNIRVMIIGFFLLVAVFIFFKYTLIGQGNPQIRRMRTAFDPNDASLQVRLENQKRLKAYLATRPFGGGIGHGGVKAQHFLPNAFLSSIATDSWYVLIWVEQGIVGLLLHLFILFYTVGLASYRIMFCIRDPIVKMKMSALTSGMVGIMVASYGNAVLGQLPTSILFYVSMAIILNSETFDNEAEKRKLKASDNSLVV